MIICPGGWKRSVWNLWSFSLETTWSSLLLIGYSDSGTKPVTVVKAASASTGQIPLLKTSCPNPNSFLLTRSNCCCCFSAVHSFATPLETLHQVILKAFSCSPLQSHGQACLYDTLYTHWQMKSPKATLMEACRGARMGSRLAMTQLGRCWGWQMCWVEELPVERLGRHYLVDFGQRLIPLSGNPWLLSDSGLSVFLPQIYLSSYY